MEVNTNDTYIKEYLSKYPLNEQSTVASKLTKIGINYIIKTNQRYPSLNELDTIINTLTPVKAKASSVVYQKKTKGKKPLLKESQIKTPSFGKKYEQPKKRAQTVEGKPSNGLKKENKAPIKQQQPLHQFQPLPPSQPKQYNAICNNDVKKSVQVEKEVKPVKATVHTQQLNSKERRGEKIVKDIPDKDQYVKIDVNKPEDTSKSIKINQKMINPIKPIKPIKPNTQINTSNYHFQQENVNVNQEQKENNNQEHNTVKENNDKKTEVSQVISKDKEKVIEAKSKEGNQPQTNETKLQYNYQSALTEPNLASSASSGYSFRQSNPTYSQCNYSHYLNCHCNCSCNYNLHYHYPHYSYHIPTEPLLNINTDSSLTSSMKNKYSLKTEANNQPLHERYSSSSRYEPRSSFTYEISHHW